MMSTTSREARTAPSGAYPLARPFAQQNDIGFNVPMIDGKGPTSAAHAGHDFIGDQ
jgi:hypothetical protein